MPAHLSTDLRKRIVAWRLEDGLSAEEAAELAGCSVRTVYEILRLHREYNQVHNPLARPRGRRRALTTEDTSYLHSLLQANPVLYLDELADNLYQYRDVEVSVSTISRALRRLALTHKSVANQALERNEHLRATWQAAYGDIPMDYFVWLDESSVDNQTNLRNRGWSELGRACVRRATFLRGQRYSVLPALSSDGIIALDLFEGSVNKERFIRFVDEQLAPKLNPYPGTRSVVVMDNCSIHHDEAIRHIVEDECNAKLIYLPPYSPDFNPIEQAFHSLKAWLRRHERDAVRPEVRPWLIHQAMDAITPEHAVGWIQNCGYD